MAFAVMATIGIRPAGAGNARIALVAATPSISGMAISISTRSKGLDLTALTASMPFDATSTR